MVTLKDRKVYVGDPVLQDIDPSSAITSIRLIPFASGMEFDMRRITTADPSRDKSDPLLSTLYQLDIKEQNAPISVRTANIDIEDLGIVIAWHEVESLTLFDENVYAWFQNQPAE